MSNCCDPKGCDQVFTPRYARRQSKRYRRRGLDKTARLMVDYLQSQGIDGATVLEIGGGVGELQIELLERGAARAVNLELSPAYDESANQLIAEHGLTARIERRIHDIAVDPDGVEPADIVVLHRVVCCYPDYERLLGAAGDRARRLIVFSHPPDNRVSRLLVGAVRALCRVARKQYQPYVHPPGAMRRVLTDRGFETVLRHNTFSWQIQALRRAPA